MHEMSDDEWRAALNKWADEIRKNDEERLRESILKMLKEAREAEIKSRAEKQRQYDARQAIIDELKSKITFYNHKNTSHL